MAKYVPDIKTQRWVIISKSRTQRPSQRKSDDSAVLDGKSEKTFVCPFCPGNENMTPPEVYRIGSSEKDGQGWSVRVVPNKYPITDTHEVIIHSPSDTDDIEVLPLEQVTKVFTAYRDRFRFHAPNGHVMIFCNHGLAAGASLKHPHSQLVVVPKQINLDAVELEPVANVVEDNNFFVTYCPDFSQWPFETWIAPKKGGTVFGDISDAELPDFARVVQHALQKIQKVLGGNNHENGTFVYNYYIYHGKNWFLRIIPRSIHRAGFELGTGLSVNTIDPTDAAERLKGI